MIKKNDDNAVGFTTCVKMESITGTEVKLTESKSLTNGREGERLQMVLQYDKGKLTEFTVLCFLSHIKFFKSLIVELTVFQMQYISLPPPLLLPLSISIFIYLQTAI